jgi:hypothetical protein
MSLRINSPGSVTKLSVQPDDSSCIPPIRCAAPGDATITTIGYYSNKDGWCEFPLLMSVKKYEPLLMLFEKNTMIPHLFRDHRTPGATKVVIDGDSIVDASQGGSLCNG